MTGICLSVFPHARSVPSLRKRIYPKQPDLIEYRLDYVTESSVLRSLVKNKRCPIIATDRSRRKLSKALLLKAAEVGFDYVDVDIQSPSIPVMIRELKTDDVRIIASHHDFQKTPSEKRLMQLLRIEERLGGDICKLVTTAIRPVDNLTILQFLSNCSPRTRIVSFAMGNLGIPSRVLSPFFGAEFTFASIDDRSKTAEGQMSIDDLRRMWKMLGII